MRAEISYILRSAYCKVSEVEKICRSRNLSLHETAYIDCY